MKKILMLANNDVGLYKFRKELLQELIQNNYEVYISLPNGEYLSLLKDLGCKYIDTPVDRRGTNPLNDLNLVLFYMKIINKIKPDVVLTYTVKPNIYGGIACRVFNKPSLANVTGLGTSIENEGFLQKLVLFLYRLGLKRSRCVFFQNQPNRMFFTEKKIVNNNTRLIPGSGVNLDFHKVEEYPSNDDLIIFLFIGRVMKDKGIIELLEAANRVKKEYSNVQFNIIGSCEEDYLEKLQELEKQEIVKYYGMQSDVHSFIKNSHATILPSYHEGTANVLLESASSGRPVLASNVTGCIETFDEGISGLGFEVKDADSLTETIKKFIELPNDQKKAMGMAGRRKMENEYNRKIVTKAYMFEIKRILECEE